MEHPARFPYPLTPFFGRETELQAIRTRLSEPECRLLTITGPGGMGKTRLALEAARQAADDFTDGVFFIELQSLSSGDLLPVTISDALNITRGQEAPLEHLAEYLFDRQHLLVLDNFEHLLEYAGLLTTLLVKAPRVKIVVTSREPLGLQEEWLFPLSGIQLSGDERNNPAGRDAARTSSVVQMFATCAKRVRPDFSLDDELDGVIEICKTVEGMPLAIELAASWTRMLRCEIIAREIRENVRFLESSLRNIPERHRSLLAVFEQTWRMLSPEEQQAFRRLSVFRGGFDQAAARAVTQANLAVLGSLHDKSLLHRNVPGKETGSSERFELHQLLRQYAQDLLAQSEVEQSQTFDRFCDYYMDYLKQRNDDLKGQQQQAAVQEIQVELDNILAAWKWTLQKGYLRKLSHVIQPLDTYFQFQSRFQEGAALFEETIKILEGFPADDLRLHVQAQMWIYIGWYFIRFGQLEQAQQAMDKGQKMYAALTSPPPADLGSEPMTGQAVLANLRGAFDQAVALGQQALEISEERDDTFNGMFAHYVLASAYLAKGEYEMAQRHAQITCREALAAHNQWILAYGLNEWGHTMYAVRDAARARELYSQSYRIRQALGDPEGVALALAHLGKVALLEGDYAEAQRCFQQSSDIYTTIFDRGGLSTALNGLGVAAMRLGRLAEGRNYLGRALTVACETRLAPYILAILVSTAELFISAGRRERGLALLYFVQHSPASNQETRRLATEKLAEHPDAHIEQTAAASVYTNEGLHGLVTDVQLEIEALEPDTVLARPDPGPAQPVEAHLEEGQELLTQREIEILRCMSDGLSNQLIAKQLVLSLGTVKWYTSQIYAKLQVNSRTQAIASARKSGIL